MFTFLKILFFGAQVALTENPIDLSTSPYQIDLDEPLSAITSGAHLQFDITSSVPPTTLSEQRKAAEALMPENCLRAELLSEGETIYTLDRTGVLVDTDATLLSLSHKEGLPTDVEFTSVTVRACKSVERTTITWWNFKM